MHPSQQSAFLSRRPSRRLALTGLAALATAGAAVLAGCREQPGGTTHGSATPATGTSTPGTTAPATTVPTPSGPASPADETGQIDAAAPGAAWHEADSTEAASSGDAGVETDLRVGRHDGYDRVVVETNGTGTLGYQVDVIAAEEAATQGRGDQVSVAGSHVIRVIGRGTHMPVSDADVAADYAGPRRVSVDGKALREVVLDPTFEGQFQLFLGTESTTYRVLPLSDPTRLVIDVRH